ncbi:MAG: hypothetical protein HDS10_00035 [Bacteroides sp.]|nr:hypothetical protein [Bacteroides sp.]
MKKLIILLSLCLLFISGGCSDKDEAPEDLILNQTVWKGILYNWDDFTKEQTNYEILLTFSSEEGGYFNATDLDSGEEIFKGVSFIYQHDGKQIHIYSLFTDTLISGYWWITESTNKKMTLETFPGTDYSSKMILTKKL